MFEDQVIDFRCRDHQLFGIASVPPTPAPRGVLIVVGGPQYRAGSHRQFVLLARSLAAEGIAAMRFDYRGMGDSEGEARDFQDVDADLRAAIDAFQQRVPAVEQVVIWGLCDAASAALFYAATDARVRGLVLLNPWVRTDDGLAKATLKHYYGKRLFDPALWKKIASGAFDVRAAAASLWKILGTVVARPAEGNASDGGIARLPLRERMLDGLRRFDGKVLFIISPADMTAQEFLDMTLASPDWQALLRQARVSRRTLEKADHTFSRAAWRDQVAGWTSQWVRSW